MNGSRGGREGLRSDKLSSDGSGSGNKKEKITTQMLISFSHVIRHEVSCPHLNTNKQEENTALITVYIETSGYDNRPWLYLL